VPEPSAVLTFVAGVLPILGLRQFRRRRRGGVLDRNAPQIPALVWLARYPQK
jgi:hypothetical protein